MAGFDLVVVSGATLTRWSDPVGPNGEPSRVRPHPGFDQLFYLAKVGTPVRFEAIVGGVQAPSDATLGGLLFDAYLPEGFGPPIFTFDPGTTSRIYWTPMNAGHHVIGIRRPQNGAVLVPVDVRS